MQSHNPNWNRLSCQKYLLFLLRSCYLTFTGPCSVSIFQYISNEMQRYAVYLFLETSLDVSGGISTHHQEHTQLYLQYLVLVKLLLLRAAITVRSSNSMSNLEARLPGYRPTTSRVHYTTSCKHCLVLLRMDEIIIRNMLS
jgi:hypothetical protein